MEFVVNRSDLLSAPRWATADDAPPLAPRAAVRAALELLPKVLPAEDLNHWSVRLITLQLLVQSDTWVYIVELERAHVCATGAVCSGMEGPADDAPHGRPDERPRDCADRDARRVGDLR